MLPNKSFSYTLEMFNTLHQRIAGMSIDTAIQKKLITTLESDSTIRSLNPLCHAIEMPRKIGHNPACILEQNPISIAKAKWHIPTQITQHASSSRFLRVKHTGPVTIPFILIARRKRPTNLWNWHLCSTRRIKRHIVLITIPYELWLPLGRVSTKLGSERPTIPGQNISHLFSIRTH